MNILGKNSECHPSVCSEKRWGLLFLQKMVITPATKMMTPETMMTVSWWRASRTRPGETILNFLCANMRQAYFKAIYLHEHHSPHVMNDFMLTTISVIFFTQHHISLIKCCRPSNSRVKGKSPPTTNNPWTKGRPYEKVIRLYNVKIILHYSNIGFIDNALFWTPSSSHRKYFILFNVKF